MWEGQRSSTCYFYMAIYTNDPTVDISLPIKVCCFTWIGCPTFEGGFVLGWCPLSSPLLTNFPLTLKKVVTSIRWSSNDHWSRMVTHSSSFVPIKASCFILYLFGSLCGRAVSSLEGSLKPTPPSPPEIMICVNWAFDDCFCGNPDWR